MAKTDMANNVAPILHIPPAAYTGTQTPASGVNLQGYEGCTFIISTGVITDGTWTITFEESDSASSGFVAIQAADYPSKLILSATAGGSIPGPFTNVGNAFNNKIYKVGYIGQKQYVRCVVTETAMGTAIFQVAVVLGDPHFAAVSTGYA